MLLIILAFIQIGLESSSSNTKVFIYNTDTLFTCNRNAIFVSYSSGLNFLTVSVGKHYSSIIYNYEKGIFTSYGSFLKDSAISFSNFYASLKTPSKLLEFFYEKDGEYDTILKGGKFIGATARFSWPQKGIELVNSGKYGLDSKEPCFSFTLSSNSPTLSIFFSVMFEEGNHVLSSLVTHNIPVSKDIYLENTLNILSKNARFQSLVGANKMKTGMFLEADFNEKYILPGLASNIFVATQNLNFMFLLYGGYKWYKDTFFNTNTPHVETNGNLSFTFYGISLGITGALILEKETKSFYLTSCIAKDF